MFSSLGLFKEIQCPERSHCLLVNCIFSHDSCSDINDAVDAGSQISTLDNGRKVVGAKFQVSVANGDHQASWEDDRQRKKRKLSEGIAEALDVSEDSIKIESRPPRLPTTAVKEISPPPRAFKTKAAEHLLAKAQAVGEQKTFVENKSKKRDGPLAKAPAVSLNPRMIRNPPVSHAVRMQLISMLHEQMVRLNNEISKSDETSKSALMLSQEELILEALEEEEAVAKHNPTVYPNIIKLRITKLKKLKLAEWKEERLKQIAKRTNQVEHERLHSTSEVIETGLSTSQEIAFLSKMLAKQDQLTQFGYVATPPSDKEVDQAREGVSASQGWEQCDRCRIRFQVFAGRREDDGALTSGGKCSYHPAKPRRPLPKDKADKGHRDSIYACCNEPVGTSIGCHSAPTHVFKVSDPKRLALIMPFQKTPSKSSALKHSTAVCFDCEMGYTTMGLELIRLTATSWPKGEELLDVLVRPLGEILDLNSQFSGVWPNDYTKARPYDTTNIDNNKTTEGTSESPLRLVDSPAIARALLFDLLTPETPLIGHALDNDLNAARIIHPSIVDSVLLYPHPRGLPIRFGLKALMKRHLDRDIQMGGANGHDSKEDARAAGELVRLKVADTWRAMQKDGWTVRKGDFFPPSPAASTT